MTDRDRLVKQLCKVHCPGEEEFGNCPKRRNGTCQSIQKLEMCQINTLADHLIANGVIVPPCNVGDKIYRIIGDDFAEWDIEKIVIYPDECGIVDDSDNWNSFDDFGKTVFLTKEEAERALKERKGK